MIKVSRQLTYVVLKPFRFAGRGYQPGDAFNARRADPRMGRLRGWIEDGVLGLEGQPEQPEEEPEAEEPEAEQPEAEEPEAEDDEPEGEES